ncbi:MAG: DUF3782 domain-containing protein [Armatimonadota bacterium]|nr:DUF3782 domain-containing protein [Armatimonadota bacterium]
MPLTARDLQELVRLLEREPRWREALRAALWKEEDLVRWLRERLPRLLQEEPRFGAEVVGILAQTLSPRSELIRVLEEIRALREDMDRRFAAMDERFRALQEDMDRRFAAMDERFRALQEDMDRRFRVQAEILDRHGRDLRCLRVGFGSLGRRFGLGFEEAVRGMVEEFAGVGPLRAERLVLRDEAGEVFGVPGQVIEFDAFVHDGDRFLVEVKAFAQREDVLLFRRKVEFAARQLGQTFRAVMVAPFAHRRAVETARELGVQILAAEEPPEGDA